MDPNKVKKALEVAGGIVAAATSIITVVISLKEGRRSG
jgi:hypothetical protein